LQRRRWQTTTAAAASLLLAALTLRPAPPAPETTVRRTVHLHTEPAGATAVLVPIDDYGEPVPTHAIRPSGKAPLTVPDVPAGDYLVVVNLPGYGFHEVYRRVPTPDQAQAMFPHNRWRQRPDGTIELPPITILPTAAVRLNMVRLDGGKFEMGADGWDGQSWKGQVLTPAHERSVAPFYLDGDEVTTRRYKAVTKDLPPDLQRLYPKTPADFDAYPVTFVSFHMAREYAELVGKRLPTEAEYEFAATGGDKRRRYPWGDKAPENWDGVWKAGPVGHLGFDRSAHGIRDLYSNVAEWTDSHQTAYAPRYHPSLLRKGINGEDFFRRYRQSRVVRGAPSFTVLPQVPCEMELAVGARGRFSVRMDATAAGLGFRCACSPGPRFLD
jgi:serine/threonine-protein kinase